MLLAFFYSFLSTVVAYLIVALVVKPKLLAAKPSVAIFAGGACVGSISLLGKFDFLTFVIGIVGAYVGWLIFAAVVRRIKTDTSSQ